MTRLAAVVPVYGIRVRRFLLFRRHREQIIPTVNYLWNPINDNIVRGFDDEGNVIAHYTTEPGYQGAVITEHRNGATYYHHHDGQGNLRALTNDQAEVTDTFCYNASGEVTERTGTTPAPFQFGGEYGCYTDQTTGQVMARRRDYEPPQSRWRSADPAGLIDSPNPYQYVQNNPINLVDPSGLFTVRKSGNFVHRSVPDDIDPTVKRTCGARWRFIWDCPTDGDVFSQLVTGHGSLLVFVKPCKYEGAELPPDEEVCDFHAVHWQERFNEQWSRAPAFGRDNHKSGGKKAKQP